MPESTRHLVRVYLIVYLDLLLLLGLTVYLAFVPMGIGNPLAAMTIAVAKTALIALFFMHLQRDAGLVRLVAVAGLLWLSLLFGLSLADYLTRPPDTMGVRLGAAPDRGPCGPAAARIEAANPSLG